MTEEKKLSIAIPGEWIIQKTLGPTLEEMGQDIKKLYSVGRDKIINKAYRKIDDPDDGKKANPRVTWDTLSNGAFTDDEVCAEYFGGILASARSEDGKDDSAIQFVDVIKSLSSKQLHLHYVIYNALNKLFVAKSIAINVAQGIEIQNKEVWFSSIDLVHNCGLLIDTDLNILNRQGILYNYQTAVYTVGDKALPYASAKPTTFGILLYAIAHNRFSQWRDFNTIDYGDFEDITLPNMYALSLKELADKAGLKDNNEAPKQ